MNIKKTNLSTLVSAVRKGERRRDRLAVCLLIAVTAASAICFQLRPARAPQLAGRLQDTAAIERLKQDGHYESLQAAMNQARFGVNHTTHSPLGRAAWHAPNGAAGYDAYVTGDGVSIAVNDESYVSLSLRGIGYGEVLHDVAPGEVSGDGQSINIERNGVQEWFVNGPDGLEHGFTLAEAPGGRIAKVPLRVALQVGEGWRASASDDGARVVLRNANGQAIEYGKLIANDQLGQNIPARLTVADEQVVIEVEDGTAQYPLTIDPLFTLQQKLTAADGAPNDYLGYSVALDGNTAVIGAPYDDDTRGSAYVFVRSGTTWTQQTRLTANDGALNDYFGWSVAIKGDTALIGTLYGPGNADADEGAAYVFVRSGTTWTLQKKLIADDGQAFAQFGTAVALDGDTAIIGAPDYQRPALLLKTGAAYIFTRSGTTWSRQAKLLADDGDGGDQFGAAVAVDGDTVLVGAPHNAVTVAEQGAAYIFTRAGTNWTQQPLLTTSPAVANAGFGNAVALNGESALIGAYRYGSDDRGSVYSYRRFVKGFSSTGQFSAPNPTADGHFGASVALSGDTAIVGAALGLFQSGEDQRSAYAFVYSGVWNYVRQFGTDFGSARDGFGYAVAISGDTVLVGAYRADVGNDVSFGDQGAAYTFVLRDSRHVEQPPRLTSVDGGPKEYFGEAVAVDGDTLAVGAYAQTIGGNTEQGAVYIFVRNGTGWTFQRKLTANDGAAGDSFGWAVALSGDTLVVGAYRDDIDGKTDQGSAYIFTRSGTTWTQQQKLSTVGTDSSAFDNVGYAVAVSGQTVAVGARGREISRGAVYVYVPAGAVWTPQQKLSANDGKAVDSFGSSVALSGNTLATGAPQAKIGLNYSQGAAYVFTRTGTLWTQQQKLVTNDGAQNDAFGAAIALDGDAVAVGAPKNGNGQFNTPGAAYVFERSNNTWLQQPKLSAGDGIGPNTFGNAVALKGSLLVVGARGDDNGIKVNQGAAYVFTRVSNWFEQQKLTTGEGAEIDNLGASVAISGEAVVVGAPYRNIGVNNSKGAAYTFTSPRCPAIAVNPATVSLPDGSPGVAYNQPLTAAGGGVGEYHFAVTRGSLPPGIVVLGDQGLGGTPLVPGTYRFTITATYLFSLCAGSREYTLTILPCPTVTISPATLSQGVVGKAYNRTLTVGGIPGPYSFAVTTGALPPGLSLSFAGALSGTPTQAGSYSFTITGGASGCLNSQAYTLTILPTCPTFGISPAALPSGNVGAPYNQPITVTGGAEPYLFAIKVAIGGGIPLPPGINLIQGSFVGTPTQTGTYTVTVVITDANQCETTKTYTITINPGCPPLVLNPTELASGTIDVPYLEFFTLTGGIGTRVFSVTSGSLPPGLTLTMAGALSGTPRGVGGFNFTVTAAAGGCTVQRLYTLVINCPTITISPAALPAAVVGTAYNQTLTATGGSGTQTFAVTAGTLPPGLSLSSAGILSGTPTQAGVYNFDIGVSSNTCLITDDFTLRVSSGGSGLQYYPLAHPVRLLETR
ncbi:MAG TPA: putative Ig domain-containing protein, partial [Blastocatellia bacterium]|nr:putative Ig domain-containing protein [Blastocatellia bacterium]